MNGNNMIGMMINIIILMFSISISSIHQSGFNQDEYHQLLQRYVDDEGLVNYRAIEGDKSLLDAYLNKIANLSPEEFKKWNRESQMAFWINTYNAITIEGIIRNYPIQYGNIVDRVRFPQNSIRQIGGFWDKVFIKVMGKEITLNDIEHRILRKEFKDPRIHAVLVCAAIGCPILDNRAFQAEDLDERLNEANIKFINNPDKVLLNKKENKLYISSIFDWYKQDFTVSDRVRKNLESYDADLQGIIEFIIQYLPEEEVSFILKNKPKIEFYDYDWTLNEQT